MRERKRKTTSSSSVTKKAFSKHWETKPEKEKILPHFGVVLGRKTKEHRICPE